MLKIWPICLVQLTRPGLRCVLRQGFSFEHAQLANLGNRRWDDVGLVQLRHRYHPAWLMLTGWLILACY
jgi:hypothetical protein